MPFVFLLTEAADVIRHLLTVNPAKRATTEDICYHWWINLGYKQTPIQEIAKGKPVNFHILEQSLSFNASSDSDDGDSDSHSKDKPNRKPLKGILKKPKDFSPKYGKIMCDKIDKHSQNSKNKDNKSECKDVPKESTNENSGYINDNHTETEQCKTAYVEVVAPSSHTVNNENQPPSSGGDTVFDSNKKPKRGILKNSKHKYTGADSGCVLEEINITEYFSTSPRKSCSETSSLARQSSMDDDGYDLTDIEAVLDSLSFEPESTSLSTARSRCSEGYHSAAEPETGACSSSGDSRDDSGSSSQPHGSTSSGEYINDSLTNLDDSIPYSTSTPSRKLKGILKRNGKYSKPGDPTWRYSLGSQSSNSSGDILDFSYDSGDGTEEHFMVPAWEAPLLPPSNDVAAKSDEGIYNEEEDESGYRDWHGEDDAMMWLKQDETTQKMEMFNEAYFEVGIHREAVTSQLLQLDSPQELYNEAVNIINKFS